MLRIRCASPTGKIVPPYPGAGPVITHAGLWGAEDPQAADSDGARAFYCAVARKP
ncbi:MAG: hypothetical protein ACYCO9_11375 [Streptosporangiaceae bacterium]